MAVTTKNGKVTLGKTRLELDEDSNPTWCRSN